MSFRKPVIANSIMICLLAFGLVGCSAIVKRLSDNLTQAVLDHDDPETIRAAAPAYMILIDSMIVSSPENATTLSAGASLYAAYGTLFADDPSRSRRLTERAKEYGRRAACTRLEDLCGSLRAEFSEFEQHVLALKKRDVDVVYALAVGWLSWINANSDDWTAIGDLPRVEILMDRVMELDDEHDGGTLHLYMGRLKTIRPPALGGEPEIGRGHFERAIELSGGQNLAAKVEFARSYARLVYDRELHDLLLNEVLRADVRAEGFTLLNVMAQAQARELLASADDYF